MGTKPARIRWYLANANTRVREKGIVLLKSGFEGERTGFDPGAKSA